jgi:hypothetical protein
MYKHLSKSEQTELSEVLQRVAIYSKPDGCEELQTPLIRDHETNHILGIPVLRNMKIVEYYRLNYRPIESLLATPNQINATESVKVREVFLYNPFTKKNDQKQIILISGEMYLF